MNKANFRDVARAIEQISERHDERQRDIHDDLHRFYAPSECYALAFEGEDGRLFDQLDAILKRSGWTAAEFSTQVDLYQRTYWEHIEAKHPDLETWVIYYEIGIPYDQARHSVDYFLSDYPEVTA